MAVRSKKKRLSRDDWMRAALETMSARGVQEVKISVLATELGVTTGSFYWHFEGRQDLLDSLLEWWESEMTDAAIAAAQEFAGPPEERIRFLMRQVMGDKLARYDIAVCHWALSDRRASRTYRRALKKRLEFAAWMFSQAGFSEEQARARGRIMVVYMMGGLSLVPRSMRGSLNSIGLDHAILTSPDSP